jgi:glutathione synthase/RimK-type ligase-like ATP-grasp enzyme
MIDVWPGSQVSSQISDVVVAAARNDVHAQSVMFRVQERGVPCSIWDIGLVAEQTVVLDLGSEIVDESFPGVSLTETTRVWWRRPRPVRARASLAGESARFSRSEWQAAVDGVLAVSPAYVVNDPHRERVASNKIFQLSCARRCGLSVPRTLVTSDAQQASNFIELNRAMGARTVCKPLTPPLHMLGHARIVSVAEDAMAGIEYAPVILQQCIERGVDLRLVVVGEDVFCGAIEFAGEWEDWRLAGEPVYQVYRPDDALIGDVRRFMSALGLAMGSLDLRVDPIGEPFFLEVNPSGQFLFLELELDLPISESIARVLTE